jgi:hypothetical protein
VNTSPLPHACHMSRPPHPPQFNHPNKVRWIIFVGLVSFFSESQASLRVFENSVEEDTWT